MDSALRENQASAATDASDTPYSRAVTGFKNYWYPILDERSVGRRPKRMVLLGEPIALVRRGKRIYAVQDECPHRGARHRAAAPVEPSTRKSGGRTRLDHDTHIAKLRKVSKLFCMRFAKLFA